MTEKYLGYNQSTVKTAFNTRHIQTKKYLHFMASILLQYIKNNLEHFGSRIGTSVAQKIVDFCIEKDLVSLVECQCVVTVFVYRESILQYRTYLLKCVAFEDILVL